MLLSFRVSNHKSIRDEQTLHMQPVYDKSRPALPVAAIFGANAAGKSNILDAFAFMVDGVRNSIGSWLSDVPRSPFRLDPDSTMTESTFTVELLLDNVRWTYGFTVDDTSVREEWLYTYPHNRRRIVFERRGDEVSIGTTGGLDRGIARFMVTSFPAALLLSLKSAAGKTPGMLPAYNWFTSGTQTLMNGAIVDEQAVIRRLESTKDHNRLVDLIVAADVGIVDVGVEYLKNSTVGPYGPALRDVAPGAQLHVEAAIGEAPEKRLVFFHGPDRIRFSFADESHGTRLWLGYIGPALDALDTGGLLVVDEIDTSLHPHLTAQLIRLFHHQGANRRGAQLLFTTHDATLLGRYFGERILARDEIWFVEKDGDQRTRLFGLADFKARAEDNIERRYLSGSYGAIPQPSEHNFVDAVQGHST